MPRRPTMCSVEITLQVVGGRWKPVILYYLTTGTQRFGALRRAIPGVTQKMLTQQLRELEADGVISRTVYAEVPPRVEYALTQYGRTLRPVLDSMCKWGSTHARRTGTAITAKAS